ncbi:GTP-binding protein [Ferdinandcohnia sp. Marseille-Q9671]
MKSENEFIMKTYYQGFIPENDLRHPVEILGEAYMVEQEKDLYDLSYIRFAQGEVYFHYKDYEAAIYKWENISNELSPWAKKNIADAYYKLGLLSNAEKEYGSIISKDKTLTSEVSLNLFSVYLEDNKVDSAYRVLQEAINENPDYPNLTTIAKEFYENQGDWNNAIELALSEAERTKDLQWFDTLTRYCRAGHSSLFSPGTFVPLLQKLYELDQHRFKQLMMAIWESYKGTDQYVSWLHATIQIMKDLEIDPYENWYQVSHLYEEAYFELTTGGYLLRDIGQLVPKFLIHWMNITTPSNGLAPAAAILAWNDIFPSTIKSVIVREAEIVLDNAKSSAISLDETFHFMKAIVDWAKRNNIETSERLVWGFDQLFDKDATNILVLGKGKGTFINSLLGEEIITPALANFTSIQFGAERQLTEVTDTGRAPLASLDGVTSKDSILDITLPSSFLQKRRINTTGLKDYFNEKRKTFGYLPVVDGVLFVAGQETLSEDDYDYLAQIKQAVKETPVHFVLPNKLDEARVKEYFPNAVIYSSHPASSNQTSFKQDRLGKILFLLRKMISSLLKKRVEAENKLVETIAHNEEFITRLAGFKNSLHDKEQEQSKEIVNTFSAVKTEVNKVLTEKIPKILQDCSKYIKEDSNLNHLHIELNQKMNEEIQTFFDNEIVPNLSQSLQEWMENSNQKLSATQNYLNEMTESFAEGYPEKELHLQCDFKVVEDWNRDIHRMTYRVEIEKENIMVRNNPAQVLLKSAGKVLGLLPQKQHTYVFNQYKKYVENTPYTDITESIQRKFWQQFDFFKKSLQQDISLFYKQPLQHLANITTETNNAVEQDQQTLAKMKSNPEVYYDPLKLFETRLVQYERISRKNEKQKDISFIK